MFYVDVGLCGLMDKGLRWAEGLEQGRVQGCVGSRILVGFFISRLAVWAWCLSTHSFSYWLCCQWVLVRVWLYCVHRTCWRMSGALVVRVGRLLARATNYKLVNLFHCCHKSRELLGRNVRFPVLPTSYGIIFVSLSLSSFVTFGSQGGHRSDTCVPNMPRRFVVVVTVLG